MQAVLCTLLEIEGYEVVQTPSRQPLGDLLQSIHKEQPDLILLDVHLHDGSGLEVLRRVRADASVARTRVVMTSGMDMQDECLAAGADAFLLKPFMPDELLGKLRG